MDKLCTVINDKGLRFNAVLVRKGERYGLKNVLVCEGEALVEIYDARYTGADFTPLGQFVTRYFVSTLLKDDFVHEHGLNLCGHEPSWQLDKVAFDMLCRELHAATEVS